MKLTLINLLLLLSLSLATAQPITQLPDLHIFPGNLGFKKVELSRSDSALTATVELSRNGLPVVAALQPSVNRDGRNVLINWGTRQTALLPPQTFLKVMVAGIIRFTFNVNTNTLADNVTSPSSPTILYPVPDGSGSGGGGPSVLPGSTGKKYPLANTPASGFTIVHNKGTKIVRGTFYREDTGQADGAWKIEIQNDNSVLVKGISGETFTGYLWLEFEVVTNN